MFFIILVRTFKLSDPECNGWCMEHCVYEGDPPNMIQACEQECGCLKRRTYEN